MTREADLLAQAARATTLVEQQRLVAQATDLRATAARTQAVEREVDLASAVIRDTLTPVRVHEHHTAATDWLGDVDTTGGEGVEREMQARASLWYGKTAGIRPHIDEFTEQARGQARRHAGAFGEQADRAEHAFFVHAATLYNRDVESGVVKQARNDAADDIDDYYSSGGDLLGGGSRSQDCTCGHCMSEGRLPQGSDCLHKRAASGVPQVGEPGNPVAEATVGPSVDLGLDGEATSSSRAPQIQVLENNSGGGQPQLGHNEQAHSPEQANADTEPNQDHAGSNGRTAMQHSAACPSCAGCKTCGGSHRVAVRRVGYSGLPQVDQIANADDSPGATPLPPDVMFPWEMNPGNVNNAISQTEQQLAERNQMQQKGMGAAAMRRRAGQDDSGWLGDMGAGGTAPGQQDGGNPGPPDSLGYSDPVYGQGGDNGNQPLEQVGQDERNDVTNIPSQWSVGQDTHADVGGRGVSTAAREADDPELQRALAFVRQRRALLAQQSR